MVLRCDDCVKYHLGKRHELGLTTIEMFEAFSIANLFGGTIVIPDLRKSCRVLGRTIKGELDVQKGS